MEFLWFLEQFRNPVTNSIFQFFTFFGEELVVIGVVCLLFWCIDKKLALRMGLAYFISGLLVQFLKIFFCIPRPWLLDSNFKPVGTAIETATGYSFPSGHSQSAASLWGVFAGSMKKKWYKIGFIAIALCTGFSRMFLGVHTPKDVAVGLFIGFLGAFLVCNHKTESFVEQNKAIISVVFGLLSVALIAFSAYQISSGAVNEKEGMDCCKAAGAGFGFAISWYIEERFIDWNPKQFFGDKNKKKIIVFIVGLAVALLLKAGLKKVLGVGLIVGALRYAILVVWIVAIYPFILIKYVRNN